MDSGGTSAISPAAGPRKSLDSRRIPGFFGGSRRPCMGPGLRVMSGLFAQAAPSPRCHPTLCCAPVAQLDRASDYGSEGWEFESSRARHNPLKSKDKTAVKRAVFYFFQKWFPPFRIRSGSKFQLHAESRDVFPRLALLRWFETVDGLISNTEATARMLSPARRRATTRSRRSIEKGRAISDSLPAQADRNVLHDRRGRPAASGAASVVLAHLGAGGRYSKAAASAAASALSAGHLLVSGRRLLRS